NSPPTYMIDDHRVFYAFSGRELLKWPNALGRPKAKGVAPRRGAVFGPPIFGQGNGAAPAKPVVQRPVFRAATFKGAGERASARGSEDKKGTISLVSLRCPRKRPLCTTRVSVGAGCLSKPPCTSTQRKCVPNSGPKSKAAILACTEDGILKFDDGEFA